MNGGSDTFQKVVDHLRKMTGRRATPITLDTELYRDLGIYGMDLFELAMWTHQGFGVERNFNPAWYGPPENGLRLRRWLFGENYSKYDSLTVRDVLVAIDAKRWVHREVPLSHLSQPHPVRR